jgi:hypothetical protein
LIDRGDVVSRLKELGLYRPGEGQMKIHSRIVQAEDGYLYFASMDEQGEHDDGTRLPTWGSHLWRLLPSEDRWEHLLAAPEGLVAVAAYGSRVYALGYFDHVLYQYDCATGKTASVRVGSVGGHVSRQFICDDRGHAFVPRLRYAGTPPQLVVTLVEFDTSLRQVGETRLSHYVLDTPEECHGIVAWQRLADHSVVFVTHVGYVYRVIPSSLGAALVAPEGWLHPQGQSYTASLFTYEGKRYLMGASRPFEAGKGYEWVVRDLETRESKTTHLSLPLPGDNVLLYGSMTRDDAGDFYLAGTAQGSATGKPLLFRLKPPNP